MSNAKSVYVLTTLHDEDTRHISVGDEPESLCGLSDCVAAKQIENLKLTIESNDQMCEDCVEKWKDMDVTSEPLVRCDRCKRKYGITKVVDVLHIERDVVPVCRSCYQELYNSDKTNINTKYENKVDDS